MMEAEMRVSAIVRMESAAKECRQGKGKKSDSALEAPKRI